MTGSSDRATPRTQDGNRPKPPRLILASASPRRAGLLAQIGIVPDAVRPAAIDERPARGELPRPYCARVAREKAMAVAAGADDIVLGADTAVAMGRRIFGKPADAEAAAAMLRALSGRRHQVITAVAVARGERVLERAVTTRVRFKRLSTAELRAYLASEDWRGKAGAYAIQGRAGAFVPWIDGSFPAVVGLPLTETAALLDAAGYPVTRRLSAPAEPLPGRTGE